MHCVAAAPFAIQPDCPVVRSFLLSWPFHSGWRVGHLDCSDGDNISITLAASSGLSLTGCHAIFGSKTSIFVSEEHKNDKTQNSREMGNLG